MSRFKFESELDDLLRLDAPMGKGPTPRWQRKASSDRSHTPLRSSRLNTSSKTPSKTPKSKTPRTKKTPKTPSEDRFIPCRSSMNFETNYYKMVSTESEEQENESPSKKDYKKNIAENLNGGEANARILAYKTKAPTPREGKTCYDNVFVMSAFVCKNLNGFKCFL
jgi:cell division cycle protein 20 (cofactor of APC complex)